MILETLASLEIVKEVFAHPNADRVEFVKVGGYDCIVPIGKYKIGDMVVLIQPDSILPDPTLIGCEWAEPYRKRSKRVRALKFRGEFSFGIVESIDIIPIPVTLIEGLDLTEILGITKYIEPIPQDMSAKSTLPYGMGKTDEERFQNLDMEQYYGEVVDVTLKIDGQSASYYYKDGEFGVCSRSLVFKEGVTNNYAAHVERYDIQTKLKKYCEKHGVNLALRGESYGQGIQGHKVNPHAKLGKGFALFSVFNMDTLKYENKGSQHYYVNVGKELEIPVVPMIEQDVVLTPQLIQKYAKDLKKLPNIGNFEGVVIKLKNRTFKIINLHYDSKK